MKKFFESNMCKNQDVCSICRNSREFRVKMYNIYDDINEVNFDCPLDKKIIQPELPSIQDQLKNLKNATMKVVKKALTKNRIKVSDEEYNARKTICLKCDKYRESKDDKIGRCSKCGCFLSVKMIFDTEHCPINKW